MARKVQAQCKTECSRILYAAHVPYASVGDVCGDVKDLVVKTVGVEQSPEKVG